MLSQKYIKSKLDCIEDKLCSIEKSSSSTSSNTAQSNNILTNIDSNTDSYIANNIEFTVLVNPTGQSYSTFKEIFFQVLTGNIDVTLTADTATTATTGVVSSLTGTWTASTGFGETIQITADNPGINGNSVALAAGDGGSLLSSIISNWNALNPTNTVTLTETNGTGYIPGVGETFTLTGGGGVSNLSFPLTGTHGNINGDTLSCDTESDFSIAFSGTGQVYIRVKKQ